MSSAGWQQNPNKKGVIQYWTGNAWRDDGPEDASLRELRGDRCKCSQTVIDAWGTVPHLRLGLTCGFCNKPTDDATAPDGGFVLFEDGDMPQDEDSYQYMVITMKDRFLGGKFDPLRLQQALNAYAREGWRLKEAATADIPGLGGVGARNEIIFILEKAPRGSRSS